LAATGALALGCSKDEPAPAPSASSAASAAPTAIVAPTAPTSTSEASASPASDAGAAAEPASSDPMASHAETLEALLGLVSVGATKTVRRRFPDPDEFLAKTFGLSSPARISQGNKARAHHAVSRAACLEGLRDVVLQTPEQRELCGGFENMVPVARYGKKPKACIDIFEYPNRACELPMVWASPMQARRVCELAGKRLCTQEEWSLACRADPEEGGSDRAYAYGDELDLTACNTSKRASSFTDAACNPSSARTAFETCGTNTEPSGAFPRCRSRLGVYDLHGNVAEIMTRLDADGTTYSQLKGSAFFYVDVARKQHERPPEGRETYPDHCTYDPRWHVEPMSKAWHVNYHLGFRCCL
jgi:hypothetical protein